MPRRVVITGGPGAGKSTLVNQLAADGVSVVAESGRAIIEETVAKGGSTVPWIDPVGFAAEMARRDIAAWQSATASATVFDRGIVDTVGYLRLTGAPAPHELTEAARRYRYDLVIVAPFWAEIYTTDTERRQTLDEAIATEREIRKAYVGFDYPLIDLPLIDVERRTQFVLDLLNDTMPPVIPLGRLAAWREIADRVLQQRSNDVGVGVMARLVRVERLNDRP